MRMELIQPFINAADAVFAESLQAPTKILDLSMDEDTCVVSGMPRAAIAKGYANKIVSLDALSSFLVSQCGLERSEKDKQEKNEKHERTPVSSQRP